MFALTWSNTALDALADIYVAAEPDERARMAAALEALNVRLRADPLSVGESRAGSNRIALVSLLAVVFQVSESNLTVRVARVTRYGR